MPDTNSQFVRLISRHHQSIWAYILTLHPNQADADDIMQETASSLWNRFGEYDPELGEFSTWAYRFAYYEVLRFRKTQSRSKLVFSEKLVEQLTYTHEAQSKTQDHRHTVLAGCVSRLSAEDQLLIEGRYDQEFTIVTLSQKMNLPVKKLYKRLENIRLILFRCIDHKLNKERSYS